MKEKKIEITKERLEQLEGFESIIDRLKKIGFPTFMSCREYADHIEKLEKDLKHKKIAIQNRKARIKDLEKQIEKMKCCSNCKWCDSESKLVHPPCKECNQDLDKWELKE